MRCFIDLICSNGAACRCSAGWRTHFHTGHMSCSVRVRLRRKGAHRQHRYHSHRKFCRLQERHVGVCEGETRRQIDWRQRAPLYVSGQSGSGFQRPAAISHSASHPTRHLFPSPLHCKGRYEILCSPPNVRQCQCEPGASQRDVCQPWALRESATHPMFRFMNMRLLVGHFALHSLCAQAHYASLVALVSTLKVTKTWSIIIPMLQDHVDFFHPQLDNKAAAFLLRCLACLSPCVTCVYYHFCPPSIAASVGRWVSSSVGAWQ